MPARLSAIKQALVLVGASLEPPKGGGSHWKASGPGWSYPIPAHNGEKTEIGDAYIRGLCRAAGLDLASFKASL